MSKPIDKANLLKGACSFCTTGLKNNDLSIIYLCRIHLMEYCTEPCALEDWARCPFNNTGQKTILDKLSELGGTDYSSRYSSEKEWHFKDGSILIFKPPIPENAGYIEDLKKLEFENRNKFYFGCQHYFKKLKKDIDPLIIGLDLNDKEQRKQAWLKVIEKFGGEPIKGG